MKNVLALIILVISSSSVFAQPGPTDMFDKDFIGQGEREKTPEYLQRDEQGQKRQDLFDQREAWDERKDPIVSDDLREEEQPSADQESERATSFPMSADETRNPFEQKAKVRRIGVILNGLDKDHLLSNVRLLAKETQKRDVEQGDLFLLGNEGSYSFQERNKLAAELGFYLSGFRKELPAAYSVKSSPTWILETEQGQILLEGISNPVDFLDENNFYREPMLDQ